MTFSQLELLDTWLIDVIVTTISAAELVALNYKS
jgi:hypothetical protein